MKLFVVALCFKFDRYVFLGLRRVPCMEHLLHNAILHALDDERVKRVLKMARSIVSLMHSSHLYRSKLSKAQKDLKLPQHQLVNDVATRWGSKHKMLKRIKEQMAAINHTLIDDVKYRHLCINSQDSVVVDSILSALEGFQVLTDILSGEQETSISSTVPLLRHIAKLCKIDDTEDELAQ